MKEEVVYDYVANREVGMSPNLQHVVVIDIGGTSCRAGILVPQGELLQKPLISPTPGYRQNPSMNDEQLISLLVRKVNDWVSNLKTSYPNLKLNQVGISFAGPVDSFGKILNAPTVWGTKVKYPVALKDLIENSLRIDTIVANDITAAAYAYGNVPQYKSYPLLCVITISSGIGAKVYDVDASKVLIDENGFGGEIGHFVYTLSDSAPLCECGGKGHLGALASGRAAEDLARKLAREKYELFQQSFYFGLMKGDSITAKQIAEGARIGDRFALEVIDQVTSPLAHVISCIALSIGIKKFIIIGGFALGVGQPYVNLLRHHLRKIGVFCLGEKEVEEMVTLGELEYPELVGIGLMSQKFITKFGKL